MPPNNSKYVLDPVSIKSVCGGEESYIRCVEYGKKKAHYSNLNLLAKAILAGGLFYYHKLREIVGASMSVFVYGFTFPIAFMCIICTGSDLFTGNTLAVTMALYEKKVKLLDYLRVMTISLFGNYVGAVSFAFFVSYLSGAFTNVDAVEKNHFFQFLNDIAEKKVHHTFVECVSLAVGCNIFVCLAVYFVLTLKDGAGYVFSVFFAVYAFAIAGYEHIIANIYTLNIALMVNTKITVYQAYIKNLLPTLLGNYIAGAIVLGLPLYFIYKEHYYNFERSKRDNNDAQMKSLSIELRN
ncbi:formate/nitrite transporter [Plasmodium falciparum IGH-CR14]|uniref:Formate-nitrite transporter n=1 Tax=Plasmodium falciparum IGH-CR14 TaxID=580059 RepID=A0A0L1IBE6_PLAFA|nr:formate/nitrite transporter [Plasmodium falciparum IGH-CR14]